MRFTVQLIIDDECGSDAIEEVIQFNKGFTNRDTIGMTLDESKQLMKSLQQKIVMQQAKQHLKSQRECTCCHKKRPLKGSHSIQYRTLFGIVNIPSPRWFYCQCDKSDKKSFSPLSRWLKDKNSPELQYIETKWSSLISYQLTAKLLQDAFPVGPMQNASTVRNHLLKVAKRQENELDGKPEYITGCANEWGALPKPDKPITVGLDGGYLMHWRKKNTNFEIIAGKSFSSTKPAKRFGFVQTIDERPRRRLMNLLNNQGMQANQQITFLSDGADNVRDLQYMMYPESEHILDWFHVTMRMTVLNQFAKGLVKSDSEQGEDVKKLLKSIKWFLWHGNVENALSRLEDCYEICIDDQLKYINRKKLVKHSMS